MASVLLCFRVVLLALYYHFKSLQDIFALPLLMLLLLQLLFFMYFLFVKNLFQKAMSQVFVVTAETGVTGIKSS